MKNKYQCNQCKTEIEGGVACRMKNKSDFEPHYFCNYNCFNNFAKERKHTQTILVLDYETVKKFEE